MLFYFSLIYPNLTYAFDFNVRTGGFMGFLVFCIDNIITIAIIELFTSVFDVMSQLGINILPFAVFVDAFHTKGIDQISLQPVDRNITSFKDATTCRTCEFCKFGFANVVVQAGFAISVLTFDHLWFFGDVSTDMTQELLNHLFFI
jgi:hypothetical protein